mgnify:CR=1 FL=1
MAHPRLRSPLESAVMSDKLAPREASMKRSRIKSSSLLLLACLPWLQWGAGVLPLSGQAWMASAYVAGVAIAFA